MKTLDKVLGNFVLNKKHAMYAIIFIMAIGFILRIYDLGTESLWHDEAYTINYAEQNLGLVINSLNYDVHPPLDFILYHFWINLFGDTEISTRLLSVIFGTLSIYVIYRIAEQLFTKEVGILSALLFSISLFAIKYSQEVRSYSLLVFLILLSNFYYIKIMKEKDSKRINFKNKYIIGYIISSTASIYAHIFGLFYILFQNIYYIAVHKKNLRAWSIIQIIIILLFSPLILSLIRQIIGLENSGFWYAKPGLLEIFNIFNIFSGSVFILLTFAVLIGISLVKKDKLRTSSYISEKIFLFGWLLFPIFLSFIISQFYTPIFYDRYLIASLPALILLVSYAIFNFQKPIIIGILTASIIFMSVPVLGHYYQEPKKEQWRDAAKYVEENIKDGDAVLIYPQYGQYGFEYYYKNGKNYSDVYVINGSYEIKNQITKNNGIWFINSEQWNIDSKEKSQLVEMELSKSYTRKDISEFVYVSVSYYEKLNPGINKLFLYQKDPSNWKIVENGSWGVFTYQLSNDFKNTNFKIYKNKTLNLSYTFNGYGLSPSIYYSLVYNNKTLKDNGWKHIGRGISDNNGHIIISGNSDICKNKGAYFIRLILSEDYDAHNTSMLKWDSPRYLFEDDLMTC